MSENAADTTVQDPPAEPVAAPQSGPGTPAPADPTTPLKYESFQLPEGMSFEADDLGKVSALFSELQLPQEKAQKVINQLVEAGPKLLKGAVEQMLLAEHQTQMDNWVKEVRAAPDIGGANFETSLQQSAAAVKAFATPGFKALMDAMGIGNHPEVIRTFRSIGKLISEGSHIPSGDTQTASKPTEILYNHPTSKKQMVY